MKGHCFIFDIDGTIAANGSDVAEELIRTIRSLKRIGATIAIASGSPLEKLQRQLYESNLLGWSKVILTSMGAKIYNNKLEPLSTYGEKLENRKELKAYLEQLHTESRYRSKAPFAECAELRDNCMINFSIVGWNATKLERENYAKYDAIALERRMLCANVLRRFPEIKAMIGGKVSIDVVPDALGKDQVYKYLKGHDHYHVFGDRFGIYGNDVGLATGLKNNGLNGTIYDIKNVSDVNQILVKLRDDTISREGECSAD